MTTSTSLRLRNGGAKVKAAARLEKQEFSQGNYVKSEVKSF
jgi:hypothetical protein